MSQEKFPHEKDLDKKPKAAPKKDKEQAKPKAKAKHADPSEELKKQIAELNKQNEDLSNKFLRSQAEQQNMQKRYSKERSQLIKYQDQDLARDLLSSVDNLERALAVDADDKAAKQLKKGVQMTLELLQKALKDHGITPIEAEGEKFDPQLHQAVQTLPADDKHPKDTVVKVLQKGYLYKDRTLRAAMVIVAQ